MDETDPEQIVEDPFDGEGVVAQAGAAEEGSVQLTVNVQVPLELPYLYTNTVYVDEEPQKVPIGPA